LIVQPNILKIIPTNMKLLFKNYFPFWCITFSSDRTKTPALAQCR
jgi:hypothetical protein